MAIKSPADYQKELTSLYNMFNMSLEEISKSYIKYKLGSNTKEYKQDEATLNSIKAQLFTTKNELNTDAIDINEELLRLNEKIIELNLDNKRLASKVHMFDDKEFAAEGELKAQKFLYNELYIQNIIFIIIIIGNIGFYILN